MGTLTAKLALHRTQEVLGEGGIHLEVTIFKHNMPVAVYGASRALDWLDDEILGKPGAGAGALLVLDLAQKTINDVLEYAEQHGG